MNNFTMPDDLTILTPTLWSLDEIHEYPTNPKLHNDEAIVASILIGMPPALKVPEREVEAKRYILEKLFDQPIVVDEHGEILKGHGRKKALKALGVTHAPVIQRFGLSDAEKQAMRLADNRVSEGGYDPELVTQELEQLRTMMAEDDLRILLLTREWEGSGKRVCRRFATIKTHRKTKPMKKSKISKKVILLKSPVKMKPNSRRFLNG